jgi:broad specificity phosphatase PhoE/ribonuclease HI
VSVPKRAAGNAVRPLRAIVEADGGARGNPGPAGYGAVVREARTGEVLTERMAAIGIATNNVAEYSGLIAGLRAAADVGASDVEVRMDSKLVVEQMSGRWKIKHPGLRPLAAEAATLVSRFQSVSFTWIPRERNRRADALANAAMDGKTALEDDLPGALPDAGRQPREAAGADSPGRAAARAVAAEAAVTARTPEAPAAAARRPAWEPPVGPATRLILVRHGETELTAQRRYSGRGDAPLTARGQAQARAAAGRVAALRAELAAVVSSPLSRCVCTAEAVVAAAGGGPVRIEPGLIECDFGEWEGRTFTEVRERWPADMERWFASASVAPPGGESFDAVAERTGRVVTRLRDTYPGRAVVVVSHVSPIKLILRDALAAGDALLYRLFLDPAGVSIVDMFADGGVSVRTVNDTAHLS